MWDNLLHRVFFFLKIKSLDISVQVTTVGWKLYLFFFWGGGGEGGIIKKSFELLYFLRLQKSFSREVGERANAPQPPGSYGTVSLLNCRLVENIVHTSGIAQIWCDFSILGMFAAVRKCRAHINFVLSKIYDEYFHFIYHLVHLN